MKMLFTGLGRSILGETVPSVSVPDTQDLGHSFSQYGPPIRNFKVITPCRPSYKWSSHIFSLSTQQPLTAAKEITYINRSILRRFFS